MLVLALGFACEDCILINQHEDQGAVFEAILKLRKEGKSIRAIAQALGIACTTTWNT